MSEIRRFSIEVSEEALEDLTSRLANSRWPGEIDAEPWSYGSDLNYLKGLIDYWAADFDWRQSERELNQFDHFLVEIDGLDTHFIHQRSPHSHAVPLLITHGWPGSIVEFLTIIPRLTQPEKFGGDVAHAFHVVCPSLPGFGWSEAPRIPGMNARAIAHRHKRLMELLGYDNYIAQGGDWGAVISRQLALVDSDHCRAIHLNMVTANPPEAVLADPEATTEEEQIALARGQHLQQSGMGYYHIQGTRPQTLSYGLTDSPMGLAGWLVEKFYAWTDCQGDVDRGVGRYRLLTNICLYWFTNTIASSIRLYREEADNPSPAEYVQVPTGAAIYPREIIQVPRHWAERELNLIHWSEQEQGGHFAAMEQPAAFVEDLWRFLEKL